MNDMDEQSNNLCSIFLKQFDAPSLVENIKTKYKNPTIGIILCKENDNFVVEYTLPENNKQIFTNEYKLYLPDKKELRNY